MSRIWAAAFLLRRIRSELGVLTLLVVLVGTTSFVVAAVPRLYDRVSDAGLRRTLQDASVTHRNIALVRDFALLPGENPRASMIRSDQEYFGRFGPLIQGLVGSRQVVASSPRFQLESAPLTRTLVSLRSQTGLEGAISIVEGRMPASTGDQLPLPQYESGPEPGEPPPDVSPRIEIAISEHTAEETGMAVGQTFDTSVDNTDPLIGRRSVLSLPMRLEVVGIFAVDDATAETWYGDNRLDQAGAIYTIESTTLFATALIAPEALGDLTSSTLRFHYEWRYFLDSDRLDVERLPAVLSQLRRLETAFGRVTVGTNEGEAALRTDLVAVIERFAAQRSASGGVLTVAAIGPLALAAAAVVMLAVLLTDRRRSSLSLARGRGASGAVLVGAQLWEGLLSAGGAAAAGYLTAVAVIPGRANATSVALSMGIGIGTIVLLLIPLVLALRRPVGETARDVTPPAQLAPRRLVLEVTAVGVAVVGVMLVQQRGLAIGGASRGEVQFDPLLAAVPMLTGFAAGLVATRLYPLPIRALGWLAARRRDLVPVLGLRNVGRRPSATLLPLLVLLATAAFGSFALVTTASLERGQVAASWQQVGADYRIAAPPGNWLGEVHPEGVPGVEAVAAAHLDTGAPLDTGTLQTTRIRFLAVEPAAYERVVAGGLAPGWPSELLAPPGDAPGTREVPIPAILSPTLPSGTKPLGEGSTFRIRIDGRTLTFTVISLRSSVPGLATGGTFVIAPLPWVTAALGPQFAANVQFVRAPASAGADLASLVDAEAPPGTEVASRHAWLADLRTSPLLGVVVDGFVLSLALAIAYAAIAIVASLTLTAARRNRDLAFLRTLGLSAPQGAGIVVVEHGLPILLALLPGLATGITVAYLLQRDLGLDAFLGNVLPYRVEVDWSGLATVGGLLAAVVVVAIAASTGLARRTRIVDALRVGDA